MKAIYTEAEVDQMLIKHLEGLAPEGKVAHVEFNKYSSDYCVITFTDKVDETIEPPKKIEDIDDKPIDLSEIPF